MEDTAREKMRDKVSLEPGPCSVTSDAAQPITADEKSNEVLPNKELVECMSRNTANKDGEDKSVLEPTQAVTFPDVKNVLQMSAKMEQMAGSSTRSGSEEDNSSTGPTQAPVLPNIKSELKEQPVAVSVPFAFADASNILWQHRKSSSPMSILPDIVEDDAQDEAQCEDSGEQFDVVDLTVDSEEDSRGTETQQFLLAAASSG
ncbi:uncharacterized protein LOC134528071 isoform X2 [Bacillus rossius redtenbacheri]|uniref:uncharacterized protein LOC134528071 isoform X2 n=2 Tax=Bacillus rossius redtenbacheri TaxID=93214 RepID=UPI002FDE70C1